MGDKITNRIRPGGNSFGVHLTTPPSEEGAGPGQGGKPSHHPEWRNLGDRLHSKANQHRSERRHENELRWRNGDTGLGEPVRKW